jgi:hypothetical protein
MRVSAALVVVLVLAVVSPVISPVTAQVYTWTDENGVVHYTADPSTIPSQYRPGDLATPVLPRGPGGWESWGATPAVVAPAGITVRFTPGEPIVVNGHLNGVPIALLLDTGADRTLLSPAAVERAGYGKVAAEPAAVRVLGVTGSAVATVLTVPLLDIAGARIGPLSLIVHDAGLGGLDGLLGRDVLDAFTVTIDTAGGRATLVPR